MIAHDEVVDADDVDGDDEVEHEGVEEVGDPKVEVPHQTLEDLVAQQSQENARHAGRREDYLADEDGGALLGLMHRVDVVP